jgi:GNAT superfamily N-acetyltransferase
MIQNIRFKRKGNLESDIYGLRPARAIDLEFLFKVSSEAMATVDKALNPDKVVSKEEDFEKYKQKFNPEGVEVITYGGEDVGRLRVVRDGESIYVGGIQILPEFQGKGIGKALFEDLINESNQTGCPVTLEVHHVNVKALRFYVNLGFEESGHEVNKTLMKYNPR